MKVKVRKESMKKHSYLLKPPSIPPYQGSKRNRCCFFESLCKIFVCTVYLFLLCISFAKLVKVSSIVVYADETGIEIDTGSERRDRKLIFNIFKPTLIFQLNKYGLLPLLGYGAMIFTGYYIVVILVTIGKTAIEYVTDDSSEIKDAMKTSTEIFQAVVYTFVFLILYALISIFLGVGNMFKWPSKLSQCNGEILFRAEYRAEVFSSELMGGEYLTYCCKSFGGTVGFDPDRSSEQNITDLQIERGDGEIHGIGVGKDNGGWLFIGNTTGRTRPFSNPPDITNPQGCEYYPE
jgi:hypothetical protein